MQRPSPTSHERGYAANDIIVSRTDLDGHLTYVNDAFCKVGLYREKDVLGQPHSIVRHPDMPHAVFHLVWERLRKGEEVLAYVKNLAQNGDYYWGLTQIAPNRDTAGRIDGYHCTRRHPQRAALARIEPLYSRLSAEENRHADRQQGIQAATALLQEMLAEAGQSYDEFVFTLAAQDKGN